MTITKVETVLLSTPITLDGVEVAEIKLRCPTASDLRGLALGGIMRQEFDQLNLLIPRICVNAQLTPEALNLFHPFDLMEVVAVCWLFFQRSASTATP